MKFKTKYAIVKPDGKVCDRWFDSNELKEFAYKVDSKFKSKSVEYLVSKLETNGYMVVMFRFYNNIFYKIPVKELEKDFQELK